MAMESTVPLPSKLLLDGSAQPFAQAKMVVLVLGVESALAAGVVDVAGAADVAVVAVVVAERSLSRDYISFSF